jgi:hypothetical protein
MKSKISTISTISIGILALFSIFTFIQNMSTRQEIATIQNLVESNPPKIVYVKGENGYTPIKGIDYKDGNNGKNAVSYSVTNTVVKEVPLMPELPKNNYQLWLENGNTGTIDDFFNSLKGETVYQNSRVNDVTKDVETKLSNQRTWTVLYTCAEYRLECPGDNDGN